MSSETLAIIWFVIITIELLLYVILDGANLGMGILSLFSQKGDEGDRMIMRGLGPIWNANETWLLAAAGSTFGAFPVVYSVVLNALFIPVMFTGVGLIIRAISFPFYEYSKVKVFWENVFGVGSLIVAMGHGLIVGGLLSGIKVSTGRFSGGMLDFLTPLSVLTTIGAVAIYIILGYSRLLQHTDFEFAHESFSKLFKGVLATVISLGTVFLILPFHHATFSDKWNKPPTSWVMGFIALVMLALIVVLMYKVKKKIRNRHVYTLTALLVVLGFFEASVGLYPYIVPGSVTILQAASPASTLKFMLFGIGPMLPIIFAYNWYLHKIFEGSWHKGESYSGKEGGY